MVDQIRFQVYQNQEQPFAFDQGLLLFFGLSGSSRILHGTDEVELGAAGILVINPFELYRLHNEQGGSLLCMRISRQFLQFAGWPDDLHCSCYAQSWEQDAPDYQQLRELYAVVFQDFFQSGAADTAELNGRILQMLSLLRRSFSVRSAVPVGQDTTIERLKRLLDRIHAEWNTDLTLSDLAAEEYLSPSYLSRFFQKNLHISFSQYLIELRLRHAAQMLVQSNRSVTHIAYDCGFHTPSVFIEAFKQQYGQTPGHFRQEQAALQSQQETGLPEQDVRGDISILLSYLQETQPADLPSRIQQVSLNAARPGEKCTARRMLNIGYARDVLMAPVQEQIRRAQHEIGFEFVRFHGLLDEDMRIYREDAQGNPQFDFTYVSLLFDFVLSLSLKPFIEFSFMPRQLARTQTQIFDRPSIISGCKDLGKWELLIQAIMQFLLGRYGREELLGWRFSIINQNYVHLGCLTAEEFSALYCTAWRTVKAMDARFLFGGPGCFAEQVQQPDGLSAFLQLAAEEHCPPDFLFFQSYPHLHVTDPLFMEFTISQQSAPTVLSDDPSFMLHSIEQLISIATQYGLADREMFIAECTSTLWQRDLSSETCYKAVWMAKNFCDTMGKAVFGYWLLTDLMEERATLESVFHGGYGLFTYNGIPKAGYQAMRFVSMLGEERIESGPGWMLTRSAGGYQLLVYNYCHYGKLYRYRYQRLERPQDAYSVFEPGEIIRYQFLLSGLADGVYRVERRVINRQSGSSFDKWLEIGAPRYLRPEELRYLDETSQPAYRVEELHAENGLRLEALVQPLDTMLITLHGLDM